MRHREEVKDARLELFEMKMHLDEEREEREPTWKRLQGLCAQRIEYLVSWPALDL